MGPMDLPPILSLGRALIEKTVQHEQPSWRLRKQEARWCNNSEINALRREAGGQMRAYGSARFISKSALDIKCLLWK